jgi:hypothetical protein
MSARDCKSWWKEHRKRKGAQLIHVLSDAIFNATRKYLYEPGYWANQLARRRVRLSNFNRRRARRLSRLNVKAKLP